MSDADTMLDLVFIFDLALSVGDVRTWASLLPRRSIKRCYASPQVVCTLTLFGLNKDSPRQRQTNCMLKCVIRPLKSSPFIRDDRNTSQQS